MSAKKTDLITGIQCPNCGKVCALGTTECPNCHHKLPQPKLTSVSAKLPSKNNSLLVKLVAVILIILCASYMVINLKTHTVSNMYSPYVPVKIAYYDTNQKLLFSDYYVTKQKTTGNSYRFTMAYLGRNDIGKAKIRNVNVKVLRAYFKKFPHYQLEVKRKQIYLSGPKQVRIQASRKIVNQARTGTMNNFPVFTRLKYVDDHNQVEGYVAMLALGTPTN